MAGPRSETLCKAACAALLASALSAPAHAATYRLRGTAYGQAQAPTGLVALEGDAQPNDWVQIEALIWAGAKELGTEADALVAAVRLHDPLHRGDLWLGRQVMATGALRPVHLDGARGLVRLPWHMTVEAFGGLAVTPRLALADEAYDWTAGGRLAQSLPGWGTLGVAYLHRRDDGRAIDHEVGGDLWLTPLKGLDLTARAAYDLQNPGLSELIGSVRWSVSSDWRVELVTTHRSSARILPATSLFSVLGDVASQYLGGRVRWRAAPRLDVIAEGGARRLDDVVVENARARAVLRLDDLGRGALSLELRRQGAPDDAGWSGVRTTLRLPVAAKVDLAMEAELIRPDRPASRGELWPWGLVAATFRPTQAWDVALAAEGSATREKEASFDVLARVTYRWEAEP
jgi:hypothetical protein